MHTTPVSLLQRLCEPPDPATTAAAWTRFVDLYTPLLYYWANRFGLSEADAADLVQDVFVSLLHQLPRFHYDRTKSFRSWLRAVLMNHWHDRLRKAAPPRPVDPAVLEEVAVADPTLELAESEYRARLVGRALELMKTDFQPKTWQACWQSVVDGRSAADIGAELGVRPAAVYAATARVLRRLRQELDGLME